MSYPDSFVQFSFVSDNVGCFTGKPFPTDGFLMMLGTFTTYVTIERIRGYPAQVIEAEDPPAYRARLGQRTARPRNSVGVMMAGSHAGTSKEAVGKGVPDDLVTSMGDPVDRPNRRAKFPKEKPDHTGLLGMSGMDVPLEEVLEKLARLVAPGVDVKLTVAEL